MDDPMARKDAAVYDSVRGTLEAARKKAAVAVNDAMVEAYWEIGRQIVEAQGDRAEYGKHLMEYLSERLTKEFGRAYTKRNLHYMRQFYLAFPIVNTLCSQLSWSHYRLLMRVEDERKRLFYMREAVDQRWTVRQLDREIHSFYYERLLATREEGRESVRQEVKVLEPPTKADGLLKDPYVLDFLDMGGRTDYREDDLEQALMNRLQEFLLELGRGFAFVARQQRIAAETESYYVDLVFYHCILKCYVLIVRRFQLSRAISWQRLMVTRSSHAFRCSSLSKAAVCSSRRMNTSWYTSSASLGEPVCASATRYTVSPHASMTRFRNASERSGQGLSAASVRPVLRLNGMCMHSPLCRQYGRGVPIVPKKGKNSSRALFYTPRSWVLGMALRSSGRRASRSAGSQACKAPGPASTVSASAKLCRCQARAPAIQQESAMRSAGS